LYSWYHREKDRREFNAHLPHAHQLDTTHYLDLLNSEWLPWPRLIHSHILKAAFAVVTSGEEHTPNRLLTLQRIANNPFNQQITRDKIELDKRKQSFRERVSTPPTRNQNQKSEATTQPWVPWTAEDIIHNQPKVEEAIRRHPLLSQIGLPPEDDPGPNP